MMSSFSSMLFVLYGLCVVSLPVHADLDLLGTATNLLFGGGAMTGSLDEYIDELVYGINTKISYPLDLPDYNVTLDTDFLLLPILGSLKLYKSEVTQVGTVSRSGEATVKYDKQVLSIDLALKVENIKFSGDFEAKLESVGPSGSLTGEIGQLVVQAGLQADVNQIKVTVTKFYLEAGSVGVSVKMLPVMDWIINTVINLLVYIIQWPLMDFISADVQLSLQDLINSYMDILL